MFNLTPIVKNLLFINVVMFLVPQLILPNHNSFVEYFGLRYIFSSSFFPTQLISYALIHANWSHLFSNMFGLLIFGPILEQTLGSKRFLLFYFITAVGAGIIYSIIHYLEVYPFIEAAQSYLQRPGADAFAQLLSNYDGTVYQAYLVFIDEFARNNNSIEFQEKSKEIVESLIFMRESTPMVGASGAVFGVMLGFGYLYPNLQMMLLFPPIPVRAKYLVGFYAIYALYSAVERVPGDNVAHYAHLGGMLVAFLLIRYWKISSNYY
jgi:membrane associated rhomboid family serine protease